MDIILIKAMQTFLLPPGLIILLMLIGYLFSRRFPGFGKFMVFCGFAFLVFLSLPVVANFNIRLLESDPPLTQDDMYQPRAQVIVILAGGRNQQAPEFNGNDTVSRNTLVRIRYGAWLQRYMRLPVLVSGGNVHDSTNTSEAELMQQALQQEFRVPVRWLESASRNTWENASLTVAMLKKAGIKRIYLVTQAFHMPRSKLVFEANGMEVIPAPTGFKGQGSSAPAFMNFLPDINALKSNYYFMHEVLGMVWYKLRY